MSPLPLRALWAGRAPQARQVSSLSARLIFGVGAVAGFCLIEPALVLPWIGALCWVSLVPMCYLQFTSSPRASALHVGVAALALYILICSPYRRISPLGSVLVPIVIASSYAACALLVSRLARGRAPSPALIASAWTLLEFVKSKAGLEHGALGYTQWSIPLVREAAAFFGAPGLSWLMWFSNAAIAREVAFPRDRGLARRLVLPASGVVIALALGWTARAYARVGSSDGADTVTVITVPGHTSTLQRIQSRERPALKVRMFERHLESTRAALSGTAGPRLVLWAETSCQFHVERETGLLRASFGEQSLDEDVRLLVGGFGGDPEGLNVGFNSVFLMGPAGELIDRYDKVRLIPFDEYQPLRAIAWLFLSRTVFTEFSAGAKTRILWGPYGSVSVAICYEESFPEGFRRGVQDGAEFLVTMANYSYFESVKAPLYMHALSVMRAVENGRWLVRSANCGPSELIDPRGSVVASLPFDGVFDREADMPVMKLTVPRETRTTLYGAGGWRVPFFVCGVFLAIAVLRLLWRAGPRNSLP